MTARLILGDDDHRHEIEVAITSLVAALRAEGGEIVSWCVTHQNKAWEDFGEDNAGFYGPRGHRCPSGAWIEGAAAWDCNVSDRLLFPIPIESAEAKETPDSRDTGEKTDE